MSKRLRIAAKFAVLGLAVTGGLLAYSLSSFRTEMNQTILFSLCPPAILLTLYIDIEPTTTDLVVVWLLIASLNAVLYGVVGTALRELWKSD